MKRFILAAVLTFWCSSMAMAAPIAVQSYNSPNDVTVTNLENNQNTIVDAINSADGALIQAGTITSEALDNNANPGERWGRAFNDWVFTGLLPPTTSGTLSSTTTAGDAFVTNGSNEQFFVEKGATANTYTATKWTYVDINFNGTYTYVETDIGSAEPGTTANSIRLARVSSNATEVTAVRDDRPLSIQLGNQEDQYRTGFILTVVTPAALTVNPGVVYNGATRIAKIADTSLALGTADDWATGISQRGTSTKGYVAVNPNGSVKLTTTAPTLTDTSGNTAGDLRYSVISSVNWRVLNWFWMNANGSGNIEAQGFGDWADNAKAGDIVQIVYFQTGLVATGTTTYDDDDTKPLWSEGDLYMTRAIVPQSAINVLQVDSVAYGSPSAGAQTFSSLFQDGSGTDDCIAASQSVGANAGLEPNTIGHSVVAGTVNQTSLQIRAGTASGTYTFNGTGGNARMDQTMASYIRVTEIKQ